MANTFKLSPGKENLEVYNEQGKCINRHPVVGLPDVKAIYEKQKENLDKQYAQSKETIEKRISDVQELIDKAEELKSAKK